MTPPIATPAASPNPYSSPIAAARHNRQARHQTPPPLGKGGADSQQEERKIGKTRQDALSARLSGRLVQLMRLKPLKLWALPLIAALGIVGGHAIAATAAAPQPPAPQSPTPPAPRSTAATAGKTPAQSDRTTIHFTALGEGRIRLSYHISAECQKFTFNKQWERINSTFRSRWQPDSADQVLTKTGIELRDQAQRSRRAAFTYEAAISHYSQLYQQAQAVGDDGVLIFTGYAMSDASCRAPLVSFTPAKGGYVLNGREVTAGKTLVVDAEKTPAIQSTYVYFGKAKPIQLAGIPVVLEANLPDWLRESTLSSIEKIAAYYAKLEGKPAFPTGSVVVTHSLDAQRNGPFNHGDATPTGLIRLSFFNQSTAPDSATIFRLRQFAAHEFAHLLQPAWVKRLPDFLYEGGADFIALQALRELGLIDQAYFTSEIQSNLNNCLFEVAGTRRADISQISGGNAPYQCGVTFHTLLLAGGDSQAKARASLVRTVLDFYQANDAADFDAKLAACANQGRCAGETFIKLFREPSNVASGLQQILDKSTWVAEKQREFPPQYLAPIGQKLFASLMDEDCKGGRGYWTREGFFEVDTSTKCKTFRNGQKIALIESLSPFTQPLEAVRAVATACGQRKITLTTTDQQKVEIDCTQAYTPSETFYVLAPDALSAALQ